MTSWTLGQARRGRTVRELWREIRGFPEHAPTRKKFRDGVRKTAGPPPRKIFSQWKVKRKWQNRKRPAQLARAT